MKNTNNKTNQEPALRLDFNYNTINNLPDFSAGPKASLLEIHQAIQKAGFQGIQDGDVDLCKKLGLNLTAHARVNEVGELDELLPIWVNKGYDCASLHVGWGMESDPEMDRLVEYVLNQSSKFNFPLYIETHRATITQDMQRTVELTKRFPEIAFNGDFSHWYTGQEMVYGGFENKLKFIQPVIERVKFMHARIGNPGCIQVDVQDKNAEYVKHFQEMWTCSFEAFLKTAKEGDFICFTIELLPSNIYYARDFMQNGQIQEEGDRWQQAILYQELAKQAWEIAKKRIQIKVKN